MNARLRERLDTWYRPELAEVPSLFSPYALPNNTCGTVQDGDEE